MRFNEYLGDETSNREYKVCSMIFEKELPYDYGAELIKSGKWVFNSTIINTLTIYFKKYLAKYIASFSSRMTISNDDFASLYIGVDDDGLVKGIPFEGKLDINFLTDLIDFVFFKSLSFVDEETKIKLRRSIKLELINVDYNKSEITDTDDLNLELIRTEKEKKESEERYRKVTGFWCNIMNNQNKRLADMLNSERNEYRHSKYFDDFVSKKQYKHTYSHLYYLCDVPNYYDMMADIKIKTFEQIGDPEMKQHNTLQSGTNKKVPHYNINKILTLFRFARYKDYTTVVFRNFKVKKPPKKKFYGNLPQFLLSQSKRITEKWLLNNDLNLYVIRVDIPMSIIDSGKVMYFNEKKRKFEECYRSFDVNGPVTKKLET